MARKGKNDQAQGESIPFDSQGFPAGGHTLRHAKSLLRKLGLRARKGLAQHFLVDASVLGQILAAAQVGPQDTVLEVGPGLGILTQELADRAQQVVAVELDDALATFLAQSFAASPNVTIVHADALQMDPTALFAAEAAPSPYKLVANIPYYITSALLRHFLEASHKPQVMVVMVQRQVAQSIVAGPGQMSLLGVSVQLYGKPRIMSAVAGKSFYPAPKVDSAILRIDVYDRPLVPETTIDHFFKVVKAGFSAPRKQLRNALAHGLGVEPPRSSHLLAAAGIDSQRRAQSLSLDEWAALCDAYRASTGDGLENA